MIVEKRHDDTYYDSFENAVIGSFRTLTNQLSIPFAGGLITSNRRIGDGFFSDGFSDLGIPPMTVIECKRTLVWPNSFLDLFARLQKRRQNLHLILFVLTKLTEKEEEHIRRDFKNVVLAGPELYEKLIQAAPELWTPYKNLDQTRTYIPISAFSKSSDRLEGDEEKVEKLIQEIEKVKKSNGEDKISIILGNGVSIPFGSDPWNKLTDNLTDYLTPHYIKNIENIRSTIGNNTYASAMLAYNILHDIKKYKDALYYCIYRKYHPDEYHKDEKTTIRALSKVIEKWRDYLEVGTFNYDSFLENDIAHENMGIDVVPVYKDGTNIETGSFPIYHLHGYLPSAKESITEEHVGSIVLTQEQYFKKYSDKKSFTYRKQVELYKNKVCLFVGSSMTDVFQLQCMDQLASEDNNKLFHAILNVSNDMNADDKWQLNQFYSFEHVRPIWVHSFNDISEMLKRLFGLA